MTWVCTLVVVFHDFAIGRRWDWSQAWRRVRATCFLAVNHIQGHRPVFFVHDSRPTAGKPELTGDVALDLFACNYKGHLVPRGDDPLFCYADFAKENCWRASDAAHWQLQGLV